VKKQDRAKLPTDPGFWHQVTVPGLTGSHLEPLVQRIPRSMAAIEHKACKPFAWTALLGGTGTGKSTVFNLLCRSELSRAGVERPMTAGPVAAVPAGINPSPYVPWFLPDLEVAPEGAASSGEPDRVQVMTHHNPDFSHLAFVDTPDLDSLQKHNQALAQDIALLADAVIFVLSQEKYADQVLVQALQRVCESGKPVLVVLNRVDVGSDDRRELLEDVLQTLDPDRRWLQLADFRVLPFDRSLALEELQSSQAAIALSQALSRLVPRDALEGFLVRQAEKEWQGVRKEISRVIAVLSAEDKAARDWKARLDTLLTRAREQLLAKAEQTFEHTSRDHIQSEIRKLFSRYDLLAGPRRMVSKALLAPIKLLGLTRARSRRSRQEDLKQARHKTAVTPVFEALAMFQSMTLEALLPAERSSPAARDMRQERTLLSREEAKSRIEHEQEQLARWLEDRFDALAREVPRSKVFGMYTTSVLWGVLLLSFETAIGGGITLIEALIDSAVAPFLTKGAVELFAYREVQSIARELAMRYQEGLMSVLTEQRDRFAACVDRHLACEQVTGELERLGSLKRPPTQDCCWQR